MIPSRGFGEALARAFERLIGKACAVLLLSLLGLLGLPALAWAGDERPRVLLIVPDPDDPFARRLSAEISDLAVTLVTRKSADRLDAAAREDGAVAAIRMLPARNGVEVWMADATSGRSLLRQLIVDESPGGPNHSVVALQTAELLRTSLLYEKKEAGEPAPNAQAAPAPVERPAEQSAPPSKARPRHQGGVQAGLGAISGFGGASASFQFWGSIHYGVGPWLALALDFSLPLERGSLSGPEGSALLGALLAGASLSARWRPEQGPWFLAGGLGTGVLRVSTEGKAVEPLESSDASAVTGVGYLRADAGVTITPWLRAGARVVTGLAIPRVTLKFAGNPAGSWGNPFLGAFGMLEVPWG